MSVHLHAESLAQQLARAMQLRLAGALGDAEHLCRLDVRVTVQRVQHERIAGPLGQLVDGGLDLAHLDGGLQRPVGWPAPSSSSGADSILPLLRRFARLTLTAMRCSQVASELRVSNFPSARQALMKVSCVQSSAS